MVRSQFILIPLFFLGLGVLARDHQAGAAPAPDQPFNDRLLEIAKTYVDYGRIDDDLRWAPLACAAPRSGSPATAHFSQSSDKDTHGRKLYSLFAKNGPEYRVLEKDKKVAVGQVLVKESWVPEEVTDPKERKEVVIRKSKKDGSGFKPDDHFLPYAEKDGKTYHAAKQGDLFIMFKLDPDTADTDQGWVYGTVTPDGKKVTSAGKVESCMKCHIKAEHDRLFGMPEKK